MVLLREQTQTGILFVYFQLLHSVVAMREEGNELTLTTRRMQIPHLPSRPRRLILEFFPEQTFTQWDPISGASTFDCPIRWFPQYPRAYAFSRDQKISDVVEYKHFLFMLNPHALKINVVDQNRAARNSRVGTNDARSLTVLNIRPTWVILFMFYDNLEWTFFASVLCGALSIFAFALESNTIMTFGLVGLACSILLLAWHLAVWTWVFACYKRQRSAFAAIQLMDHNRPARPLVGFSHMHIQEVSSGRLLLFVVMVGLIVEMDLKWNGNQWRVCGTQVHNGKIRHLLEGKGKVVRNSEGFIHIAGVIGWRYGSLHGDREYAMCTSYTQTNGVNLTQRQVVSVDPSEFVVVDAHNLKITLAMFDDRIEFRGRSRSRTRARLCETRCVSHSIPGPVTRSLVPEWTESNHTLYSRSAPCFWSTYKIDDKRWVIFLAGLRSVLVVYNHGSFSHTLFEYYLSLRFLKHTDPDTYVELQTREPEFHSRLTEPVLARIEWEPQSVSIHFSAPQRAYSTVREREHTAENRFSVQQFATSIFNR